MNRETSPISYVEEKSPGNGYIENAYLSSERTPEEDRAMERRILRKTDLRLLPAMALLFLFR